MLLTSFRIAVKELGRNKLRTFLTMLGMTIGVAAVLAMIALGTAAQSTVSDDLQSAGTTLINIRAGNYTRGGSESGIATGLGSATNFTPEDAQELGKIEGVKYYTNQVSMRSWVEAKGQKTYTQIVGTSETFPKIHGWSFTKGEYFDDDDVSGAKQVAVLGLTASDRLFSDGANPVGEYIEIKGQQYKVVGLTSSTDDKEIESVYVPYTTLQKVMDIRHLQMVTLFAKQAGDTTRIADEAKKRLRTRHGLDTNKARDRAKSSGMGGNQMPGAGGGGWAVPDDFTIKTQAAEALTKGLYTSVSAFILANMPKVDQINMEEMAGTLNKAGSTMTALLAAIATISLIVFMGDMRWTAWSCTGNCLG